MSTYRRVNACLGQCLNSVLNVKALVGTFNQEKALVGAFCKCENLCKPSLNIRFNLKKVLSISVGTVLALSISAASHVCDISIKAD